MKLNPNIKKFVRENKPAKLNGGYFDGKEIFLPSDHETDLRMPIPAKPPTMAGYHNTPIRNELTIAIYRQTKDRYNWEYAGLA